ncbi:chromobox protein 3 [Pelomyxa schiedti]|nr:chromobox protein 3 [Pelomyxa schiedti]
MPKHKSTSAKEKSGSGAEESQFEVEKVVGRRTRNGKVQYYLKWKGYPSSDNTWENEGDCACADLISEFLRKLKEKKRSEKMLSPDKKTSSGHKHSKKDKTPDKESEYTKQVLLVVDEKTGVKELVTEKEVATPPHSGKNSSASSNTTSKTVATASKSSESKLAPAKRKHDEPAPTTPMHSDSKDDDIPMKPVQKEEAAAPPGAKRNCVSHSSPSASVTTTVIQDVPKPEKPEKSESAVAQVNLEHMAEENIGFEQGDKVESIVGVAKDDESGELYVYVQWIGKSTVTAIPAHEIHQREPLKLIAFYESKLKFESGTTNPSILGNPGQPSSS